MAAEVLPASLAAFKPTNDEKTHFNLLFSQADTESLGVLTGDLAVPFFSHSSLPLNLLGEIWQVSDPENSGFLTPDRFGVACRLIGHAQAVGGQGDVRPEWVNSPGPRPKFDNPTLSVSNAGSTVPSSPPPLAAAPTGSSFAPPASRLAPQGTGAGASGAELVTPEERAKYQRLFNSSGPSNGLLDGDKARDIFVKSKLPYETLGQIWNLADTHSRGALDAADFTLGMHLIQRTMNGSLKSLPEVLDPKLYASAIGPPIPAAAQSAIGATPTQSSFAPQSPQRSSTFPPIAAPAAASWSITAPEKAEADGYFGGITVDGQTVDGEKAVGFFSLSGLPIDVLAKVWDLADIRGSGALNRDEFAVALRLIRDRVAGKEVPATLAPDMIPPSLRSATAAAPPQPQRDLLDLDDDEPIPSSFSPQNTGNGAPPAFSTAPATPIFAQNTGSGSVLTPQRTGPQAFSPQHTGSSMQPTTSVFPQHTGSRLGPQLTGSKLAPQMTGQSFSSTMATKALSPQSTGFGGNFTPTAPGSSIQSRNNFFDDNDDADTQAKLATVSAQLASVEQEHAAIEAGVAQQSTTRAELEASLSSTTAALNELQVKLSSARAAHEAERTMVDDLTSRHKEQAALLARQRTELITAESDLSALRVERTEIEGNYLRDKEDVREMKRKMAEVAVATNELKEILEKMRKDSRQQKGLVAISKKQLATAEAEKEKVWTELEQEKTNPTADTVVEHDDSPFDHSPSPFDHAVPAAAIAAPLPMSPPVASPASSVRSTNPFERFGPIASAISPQPTGASSSSAAAPSSSPSMPVAAAAAIGTGAIAAVSAIGAGVASVFGSKDSKEDEPAGAPEEAKSAEASSTNVSSSAAPESKKELDPFGMPVAPVESTEPAADPFGVPVGQSTGTSAAGFSGFDDGFGDDFSSANPETVSASSAAPAGFDDEFAELDEPAAGASSAVEEPTVSKPTEEPSSSVIERGSEPSGTEPVVSDAADAAVPTQPAGTAPDSAEQASAPLLSELPSTSTAEPEEDEAFPAASANVDDSMDSSDDEDEIEDAGPMHRSVISTREPSEGAAPTSTSDSGESFVHVPSAAESKFPPLNTLEEPVAAPSSIVGPGETVDDAPATSTFETAADAPAAPTSDSASNNEQTSGDSSSIASPTATLPANRRAAPPPPPGRSSVTSPAPIAAPSSPFDSEPFEPATTSTQSSKPTSDFDDFESSFNDLPPPVAVERGSVPDAAAASKFASDFDEFDNDEDFAFKPVGTATGASNPQDDAAFADFDSAFDAPPTSQGAEPSSVFSFDDAFGSNTPTGLADSLGPAPTAAPPVATPALDDDSPAVKQICAIGFSRAQAVTALEKYDYNVERAINSLLG